ncbi:hypothetical protein [Paracerasibacillus soli]|uniref:Uncharacterized protein n=2 Tax=Paracerasibacillus soli TaxID=480284 RepID=A0ABU5CQD7_9BACI|nr:hypothetical protein [Virgibacillus soli]MDY0407663.1 hypothetical protein [Virgibacillus soli]
MYGNLSDIEESSYWQYIRWYFENERMLHHALQMIEKNTQNELSKRYVIDKQPKQVDERIVKWQNSAKGQVVREMKFLNKNLFLQWDTHSNRVVKYRVFLLSNKLKVILKLVTKIGQEYEREKKQSERDIRELEYTHKQLLENRFITDREKSRIGNALKVKKLEFKKLEDKFVRATNELHKLIKSRATLNNVMNNTFWSKISDKMPHLIVLGKHVGYQIFNKLWIESNEISVEDGSRIVSLPVYKPTYELYEYYVYFGAIHALETLEFKAYNDSLWNQLTQSFFEYGLKDGTKVTLSKDHLRVDITYDELIEHDSDIALDKDKHFYSAGINRKPDIRIDLYEMEEQGWKYTSSFIIEVKYSPFYNIYSKQGRTRALEQLSEYWRIKYVYKEGHYEHKAIHKVICIYPGTNNRSIKFNSEHGIFLQFYPNADSDDNYDIVGKKELIKMLKYWIIGN